MNLLITFSRPTKPTRSQKIDWIEINLYTILVVVHHSEVSTSARIEELDYSKLIHSHELAWGFKPVLYQFILLYEENKYHC